MNNTRVTVPPPRNETVLSCAPGPPEKAGSSLNLLRWAGGRTIRETFHSGEQLPLFLRVRAVRRDSHNSHELVERRGVGSTASERIVIMETIKSVVLVFALVVCSMLVLHVVPASAQIVLAGSTPEDGADLGGPVRTVRVWFDQSPQVSRSTLEIPGRAIGPKSKGYTRWAKMT